MGVTLSRRQLMTFAVGLPFAGFLPSPARSEPITASLLLAEFAKAAGTQVGKQLLASFFNGDDGPSNADVIAAIEKSTKELKMFVSQDVRAALTEAKVVELGASAETAFDDLISYVKARPENKEAYAFRLKDADKAARYGANLADKLGEPAMAVYSMFISLRILSESELFRLWRDEGVYQNFGASLLKASDQLVSKVENFLARRSPSARLGQLTCTGISNGAEQGFNAPSVACEFTLDGEKVAGAAGFTTGSDAVARSIIQKAVDKYRATEAAVSVEYSGLVQSVGNPMLEISAVWRGVSAEITGANIPTFRHDPTYEFPSLPIPSQ